MHKHLNIFHDFQNVIISDVGVDHADRLILKLIVLFEWFVLCGWRIVIIGPVVSIENVSEVWFQFPAESLNQYVIVYDPSGSVPFT